MRRPRPRPRGPRLLQQRELRARRAAAHAGALRRGQTAREVAGLPAPRGQRPALSRLTRGHARPPRHAPHPNFAQPGRHLCSHRPGPAPRPLAPSTCGGAGTVGGGGHLGSQRVWVRARGAGLGASAARVGRRAALRLHGRSAANAAAARAGPGRAGPPTPAPDRAGTHGAPPSTAPPRTLRPLAPIGPRAAPTS